jgi:hypothetical protein
MRGKFLNGFSQNRTFEDKYIAVPKILSRSGIPTGSLNIWLFHKAFNLKRIGSGARNEFRNLLPL